MELEEVLEKNGLLAVPFGATRDEVVDTLGPPENWTDSDPIILQYGDLQLTFVDSEGLWLATIWNVDDRLRLRSEDLAVHWRLTAESLTTLLAGVGVEIPSTIQGSKEMVSGFGPNFRAHAR